MYNSLGNVVLIVSLRDPSKFRHKSVYWPVAVLSVKKMENVCEAFR